MTKFRKPEFNRHGGLDCEIDHPKFGWIPYTISQIEQPDLYDEILATNPAAYVAPPSPPPPTLAEIDADIEALTEDVMNGTDRDRAFGMLLADMWRAANPGMTVADARNGVRARFKSHLEALRKG